MMSVSAPGPHAQLVDVVFTRPHASGKANWRKRAYWYPWGVAVCLHALVVVAAVHSERLFDDGQPKRVWHPSKSAPIALDVLPPPAKIELPVPPVPPPEPSSIVPVRETLPAPAIPSPGPVSAEEQSSTPLVPPPEPSPIVSAKETLPAPAIPSPGPVLAEEQSTTPPGSLPESSLIVPVKETVPSEIAPSEIVLSETVLPPEPSPIVPAKETVPSETVLSETKPSLSASIPVVGERKISTARPGLVSAVDLSDEVFITGTANGYRGAVVASGRRSKRSGGGNDALSGSSLGGDGLATSVTVLSQKRSCSWPKQALNEDLYEQEVRLRVLVRTDGAVADVELIEEPGYGFAEAAIRCARQTTFAPATNRLGQPVQKLSPPITVRFIR